MKHVIAETEKVQKKWVWVPCPKELYKPAYITEETDTHTTVQSDFQETFRNSEISKMNPTKFDRVEDLASLSHLNEPSVLHNIKSRYSESLIYTYSGLFLLALNPYRRLGIYSDEMKKKIMMQKSRAGSPHIFVTANEAYRSMVTNKANQSILITGESGAGKTENTKRVIEFLAHVAGTTKDGAEDDACGFHIEDALMSTNPVLEAFGNAKTIKNDNSSRFGKFIQVKFKGGKICGAKIEKYLLEKSRVTSASSEERSFHIFYYLLAGASEELRKTLYLTRSPSDYGCLKRTTPKIPNVDDAEEFAKLNKAFEELGIADPTPYYKIVAAILHLSNIEFGEQDDKAYVCAYDGGTAGDANNSASAYNPCEVVCELLGISVTGFINAILNPVMKAGTELVVHYRTEAQALAVTEGLMKMLFETLFDDLIAAINKRLDSTCDSYIGILDIAGFEIFTSNSFEQLCINYTNEKLQQYFNHHMFILEQEIYRCEQIEWDFIDFGLDLEPTIAAIESSNPIGILSYLDEECVMPGADDNTLLDKLKMVGLVESVPFKNNFSIKHYAGKVEYEVSGWLRKNKDTESEALLQLLKGENNLISNGHNGTPARNSKIIKKGVFKTVAQSHKEGLRWLMDTLKETQPHFVRCILPNLKKSPELFEKRHVLDQLRCNGVLEGIRISRLGYPSRLPFADFNKRYKLLATASAAESNAGEAVVLPRTETESIVAALNINKNNCKIGRTMVFFRQGVIADLEEARDKRIQGIAEALQNLIRSKLAARAITLDAERLDAIRSLQRNAGLTLNLLRWKWWALYLKIAPLLDVKKAENDRRIVDEQMQGYTNEIEKLRKELAEREKEIVTLGVSANNLKSDITRMESLLADKEGLLEALRQENAKIPGLVAGQKEKEMLIADLREKIDMEAVKEQNHSREHERMTGAIEDLERRLKKKEDEIEMIAKQDLGSVLKAREAELVELNQRLAVATRELEIGREEFARLVAGKDAELVEARLLLSQQNENLSGLREQLETQLSHFSRQAQESAQVIAKQREELSDLQLENDAFLSKNTQLECANKADESTIAGLTQDLNYQKVKNSSLEATVQSLKSIKLPEKEAPAVEKANATENNEMLLNKTIASLKGKLAFEKKMSSKLGEEKEVLYNENLRLMQSKLDDLFSTEAEFNAAKSVMQMEIRRLEGENARIKKELVAAQTASDCSDDAGFERMTLLLEEERALRKIQDLKIIELENANMKLSNTVEGLKGENSRLMEQDRKDTADVVVMSDLAGLKDELKHVRKSVNAIVEVFQKQFFEVMAKKDEFHDEIIREHSAVCEELERMALSCEELRKNNIALGEAYDALKKKHGQATNEMESLLVNGRANALTIRELQQHVAKLEEAYEQREESISSMRKTYDAHMQELEGRKARMDQTIAQLRSQIESKEFGKFDEAVQTLRRTSAEKIKQLANENDGLRAQNEECNVEIYKLRSENKDLVQFLETLKAAEATAVPHKQTLGDVLTREKIVSSFIVDKDAYKASEWKNIVAQKCQRCAEPRKESESPEAAKICELNSQINLLNLKIKQSDRIVDENKKIIDAMKSCMMILRRTKSN